jgi:hypothetical protein
LQTSRLRERGGEGRGERGQKAMNLKEAKCVHAPIYKCSTTTERRGKDNRFEDASW